MIDIIYIALSVILAGLLVWFFTGPYRQYQIDATRNRLFDLRSILHDCAYKGDPGFDSPLYKESRKFINGCIRYTHVFSLFLALTFACYAMLSKNDVNRGNKLLRALNNCSEKEKNISLTVVGMSAAEIISFILKTSIITFMPYYLFLGAVHLYNKVTHKDNRADAQLDKRKKRLADFVIPKIKYSFGRIIAAIN